MSCSFIIKNNILQVEQANKHAAPSKQEAELDMYADDFDVKEKAKLDDTDSGAGNFYISYVNHGYMYKMRVHPIQIKQQQQRRPVTKNLRMWKKTLCGT